MKKYRLKIKYPNLFQKIEIGDIVYYNSLTKSYVKAEAPHYSVSAYDVENFPDCWELIEEEEPLFITEDGVMVHDIDTLVFIVKDDFKKYLRFALAFKLNKSTMKSFFHESNADEYIWRNKPLFSYEDFMKWGNVPFPNAIKQLAKERVKQ